MGLQSILGFGQKPQSISKIKGMGEDLKGLETDGWKVGLLPIASNWGHTNSKHMVSFRGLKFGLSIPRAQELYMFSLHTLKDLSKVDPKDFHS